MRDLRDFVPGQIYGVTQSGNNGQWVFKDEEDFLKALSLIDRYSEIHAVKVQGYSLMNNHGHWMFEASTEESISDAPELLVGPLDLPAAILSRYFRAGPVNWTPRSGLWALHLDERGFRSCGTSRITRCGRGWYGGRGSGNGQARRHIA